MKRSSGLLFCLIILLGVLTPLITFFQGTKVFSSTLSSQSVPPATGDWVVTDVTSYSGSLQMNGSIIINNTGSLTLLNANVIFMGYTNGTISNGTWELLVRDGGSLNLIYCNITTDHPSYVTRLFAEENTSIYLENSVFTNSGISMSEAAIVLMSNSVTIKNCRIDYNKGFGLKLIYASNIGIENLSIINQGSGSYPLLVQYSNNLTIRQSKFITHLHNAMYLTTVSDILVENSYFENSPTAVHNWWFKNVTNGVFMDNVLNQTGTYNNLRVESIGPSANCLFRNNSFIKSIITGEHVYLVGEAQNFVFDQNNFLTKNTSLGAAAGDLGLYVGPNANNTHITNNFFQNYPNRPIYVEEHANVNISISGNLIQGGIKAGIEVSGATNIDYSIGTPSISNNTIEFAYDAGIRVNDIKGVQLFNNHIPLMNETIPRLGPGIQIIGCNNSVIQDNIIEIAGTAMIGVASSHHTQIRNNVLHSIGRSVIGVSVIESTSTLVTENTLSEVRGWGLGVSRGSHYSRIINNNITFSKLSGGVGINVAGEGIYAINIDISNNRIVGNWEIGSTGPIGISIVNYANATVYNNYITHVQEGIIVVDGLPGGSIKSNRISYCGFALDGGGGIIMSSGIGIDEINWTISHNNLFNNQNGMIIGTDDNIIHNNSIVKNLQHGILLESTAQGNFLYFNDFINNTIQAEDETSPGDNEWSRFVPTDMYYGNFWSDYSGVDIVAPSGIGDTPYNITGAIQDIYPMMTFGQIFDLPTIDSPPDIQYNEESTGNFIIWQPISWIPKRFEIYSNGFLVTTALWDGNSIYIGVDALLEGEYQYTCTVFDEMDNYASDTVQVTVVGSTITPSTTIPSETITTTTTITPSITGTTTTTTQTSYFPSFFTVFLFMATFVIILRKQRKEK